MNEHDMGAIMEAIAARNGCGQSTPSAVFLDLLRRFAKDGKVLEMATGCGMYFSVHSSSRNYITNRLPAIIFNHYDAITAEDRQIFLLWEKRNPDWANRICDKACSTELATVVAEMVSSLQRFRTAKPPG